MIGAVADWPAYAAFVVLTGVVLVGVWLHRVRSTSTSPSGSSTSTGTVAVRLVPVTAPVLAPAVVAGAVCQRCGLGRAVDMVVLTVSVFGQDVSHEVEVCGPCRVALYGAAGGSQGQVA